MAKPRERNKMMRQLAADALEAEFEALKQRRAALAELGVQLDDMRYAIDQFRTAAATLENEQSISRSYIAEALQMTSREKAAVWPPKNRKETQETTDTSTDKASTESNTEDSETTEAANTDSDTSFASIHSDEPTVAYSYTAPSQY